MHGRHKVVSLALAAAVAAVAWASVAAAQSAPNNYVAPRTPWGDPDLQGNWSNGTATPLSRPQNETSATLTWEEVAEREGRAQARREVATNLVLDPNRSAPPVGGDGSTGAAGGVGGYNSVYLDPGEGILVVNGVPRTSMIVDPPNGQMPERVAGAAGGGRGGAGALAAAAGGGRGAGAGGGGAVGGGRGGAPGVAAPLGPGIEGGTYDNPEQRGNAERCILSFGNNMGPPMLPNGFYNNNYTIVQNRDHVMIMTEMVHDTRIIRLSDRVPAEARLAGGLTPFFGDSWGRWVGDTLVVETRMNTTRNRYSGTSVNGKITERFYRYDADNITYSFTVDDPTVWVQPWTAELTFRSMGDDRIYEYACHEGNYALFNILSGARAQERALLERQNQATPPGR